ncbi:DUF2949 domain-containing protein [Synechococcus sp. M16CYN]|uniref:DUF2949 domain-containing protein n=1 Tax=Synechococcus sp. M16CYN TaxID=3103139 RepID=UPI003244BF1D
MVMCSHPQPTASVELKQFLQRCVGLSLSALQLGSKQAELEQAPLPIVLWSFGLLSLDQLQIVLDWQDAQSSRRKTWMG